MARIDWVERRLREWAQQLIAGDGSGYPVKSPLHPQWAPPRRGAASSIKITMPSSARATHRAIGLLSLRLRNTVVVHYVLNLPLAEQCRHLSRIEGRADPLTQQAVTARIWRAHEQIAGVLRNLEIC